MILKSKLYSSVRFLFLAIINVWGGLKSLCLLFIFAALFSCQSTKKTQENLKTIDLFKKVITGNFNNDAQIAAEINNGKVIHPNAKHINAIADAKIKNLPNNLPGFFVLEESYYKTATTPLVAKPYLFYFEPQGENLIKLTVYTLPKELDKNSITNNNPNLFFDYNTLKPSPTFKGAIYNYDGKVFTTNSVNDLGNGMRFTLTETLNLKKLIVMELLEKDGKKITTYDTPIIYDRK